jgi:hypothetical protein
LPSPIHAKFSDPRKLRKALCERDFNSYTLKIHPHDLQMSLFNYPGLFVLDGAAIPVAIGANPSHTIAAVAERNVEAAIRKYSANHGWKAPEAAFAQPIDDPLSDVTIPPEGVLPIDV